MRLFWKLFYSFFIFILVAIASFSYISYSRQISSSIEGIESKYHAIGSLLAREIEINYLQGTWPFDSLKSLKGENEFLFWWVIDEKGRIYLADDEKFIGTYARDYAPFGTELGNGDDMLVDKKQQYGLFAKKFGPPDRKWEFRLGFSLQDVFKEARAFIAIAILISLATLAAFSLFIFYLMTRFLSPISSLMKATKELSEGRMDYPVSLKKNDEFSELAASFVDMRKKIATTSKKLEQTNKNLEKEVIRRTKQLDEKIDALERLNKLFVGRESKMVELKQEISKLKEAGKKA